MSPSARWLKPRLRALGAPLRAGRNRRTMAGRRGDPDFPAKQLWSDGGITVEHRFRPEADAPEQTLRLLLQPDGDIMIFVPGGFGRRESEAAAARALIRKADRALHYSLRVPLAGWGAFVRALYDLVALPLAALTILLEVTRLAHADVLAGMVAPAAVLALRFAGPPLLRRVAPHVLEAWFGARVRIRRLRGGS